MLTKSLRCFGLTGRVEPESAHDGDQSRRTCHLKCGGFIFLCFQIAYFATIIAWSLCIVETPGGGHPQPFGLCRWNLGTRPPIRLIDISSWTYDENSFFVNPARCQRPWNESCIDPATSSKLPGWKSWCNEKNWSPGILRCCVLESWLYYNFEHK